MSNAGPRATRKHLSLLVSMAALAMSGAASSAHAAADLSRLECLLSATPEGGWVKVSTNTFSSAKPTGAAAIGNGYNNPGAVVIAWSSVAWDSANGDLLLWGGGHGNYSGNEMYVWDGGSGTWDRGSLPSRLDANNFVVDSAAPQSSHTYDNNVYLPVSGMFVTFGGAAFQNGDRFETFEYDLALMEDLEQDNQGTRQLPTRGKLYVSKDGHYTFQDSDKHINSGKLENFDLTNLKDKLNDFDFKANLLTGGFTKPQPSYHSSR